MTSPSRIMWIKTNEIIARKLFLRETSQTTAQKLQNYPAIQNVKEGVTRSFDLLHNRENLRILRHFVISYKIFNNYNSKYCRARKFKVLLSTVQILLVISRTGFPTEVQNLHRSCECYLLLFNVH